MDNSNALNSAGAGSAPPLDQPCLDSGTMLSRDVSPTSTSAAIAQAADNDPQQQSAVVQRVVTAASQTSEASASSDASTGHTFIVDGVARRCESIISLLDDPQLLYKFRDSFTLYFDEPLPDNDALKEQLLTRDVMKNAFLLINNIEDCSEIENSPEKPISADNPNSILYNPQMAASIDRALSVTCHMANNHADFLHAIPARLVNAITITQAGFYLSLAEQKLICHACGGGINSWQRQWRGNSLNEVHAKLFPACSYLKAEFGQTFIDQCQQSMINKEDTPCLISDYPAFYAVPPDKAAMAAEREARDYLALLFRLSHPVHGGEDVSVSWLSSFELAVDRCRYRLDEILNDQACNKFFIGLTKSIKNLPDDRLTLTIDLLQLLQDLLLKPPEIMVSIAATIVESSTWQEGSPAKWLREIKSMMVFVHCRKKITTGGTDVCQLLATLKTFFNESVLFRVLYSVPVLGNPPIMATWSFETRCWLQRHLSDRVCSFPSQGNDDQARKPPSKVLIELINAFRLGVCNQADFIDYLVKTVSNESRFLPLLQTCADPGTDATPVPLSTADRSDEDLQCFMSEQVRKYWDDIMQTTTKHQPPPTANRGGE